MSDFKIKGDRHDSRTKFIKALRELVRDHNVHEFVMDNEHIDDEEPFDDDNRTSYD